MLWQPSGDGPATSRLTDRGCFEREGTNASSHVLGTVGAGSYRDKASHEFFEVHLHFEFAGVLVHYSRLLSG